MKRMAFMISALVYAAGFVAAAEAQTPRKVKMTIPVVAHSMTPVYIAQSKSFFADEKLDLDITSTGGGGRDIPTALARRCRPTGPAATVQVVDRGGLIAETRGQWRYVLGSACGAAR